MKPIHLERKLPEILSPDEAEVTRLIAAVGNLKRQTSLALAYATGLRVNEVVHLKVGDIDSQRMTLRVEQGKRQKYRYALLSRVPLERLRVWWRVARARGRCLTVAVSRPEPGPAPQYPATQPSHPRSR